MTTEVVYTSETPGATANDAHSPRVLGADIKTGILGTWTAVRVYIPGPTRPANITVGIWAADTPGVLLGTGTASPGATGFLRVPLTVPVSAVVSKAYTVAARIELASGGGQPDYGFTSGGLTGDRSNGAHLTLLGGTGRFLNDQSGSGQIPYPTGGPGTFEFLVDAELTLNSNPFTVDLAVSAASLVATATLTPHNQADPTTYVIEWGDGQSTTTTGLTASHTYAAAGTYAVLVSAIDTSGNRDSAAYPITVVAPPGALHPTSELVAMAWLRSAVTGLASIVATTLPAPASDGTISWTTTGFVQVTTLGGSPETDYRLRHPAIGVTCWAVNQGSSKPPWGKANQLAEAIVAATYGSNWRLTNLPAAYRNAHVSNMRASEPRRLPDDGGGYARYTFDLYPDWIEV
jgi:hypothetical protein